MKERPILFRGDMVRTLLEGRKTQTRRVMKPQPPQTIELKEHSNIPGYWIPYTSDGKLANSVQGNRKNDSGFRCPYGIAGDRLWVREAWQRVEAHQGYGCCYRADDSILAVKLNDCGVPEDELEVPHRSLHDAGEHPWKPSIHMPRKLSRITLEVTGVRVERVQDISPQDCIAEGMRLPFMGDLSSLEKYLPVLKGEELHTPTETITASFAELWNQMRGGTEFAWEKNPLVWVVEFRRVEAAVASGRAA